MQTVQQFKTLCLPDESDSMIGSHLASIPSKLFLLALLVYITSSSSSVFEWHCIISSSSGHPGQGPVCMRIVLVVWHRRHVGGGQLFGDRKSCSTFPTSSCWLLVGVREQRLWRRRRFQSVPGKTIEHFYLDGEHAKHLIRHFKAVLPPIAFEWIL